MKIFWVIPPGAESWAEKEVREHSPGPVDLSLHPGGLEFSTGAEDLMHWHQRLRLPVRAMVRLYEGPVRTWEELKDALQGLPWGDFFSGPVRPRLHITSRSSKLYHRHQIQRRAETYLGVKGKGPRQGDLFLRFFRNELTISLDATGEPLYKRGVKRNVGQAPLRENLSFLMLQMATQNLSPEELSGMELVDPFAGSGTLLLEAMGGYRLERSFAFESWPLWTQLKLKSEPYKVPSFGFSQHTAYEIDARQLKALSENLTSFEEMGFQVRVHQTDSRAASVEAGSRVLVSNPPFGERLQKSAHPGRALFELLKNFTPKRAAFLVPRRWALGKNLPPALDYRLLEEITLPHGGLEVQIVALEKISS